MSIDWVVRWKTRKPTLAEIKFVAEDYFNSAAEVVGDGGNWTIKLPGLTKSPLERIVIPSLQQHRPPRQRWIEMFQNSDGEFLMISTRLSDEYTNALAAGLAEAFARFYEAERDWPT